uniref:Uncharacterized protein n=1 Tax=Anopheles funestus TaxID=62324 RepID=A0A182S4D8_ANOFN
MENTDFLILCCNICRTTNKER